MSEAYIGQIMLFGGNFAPRNWALCQGQLLSIASNTALFSILGTSYGGNGTTTFGLPDLRGRVPFHWGQGPGLSNRVLGEMGGVESVTLTVNDLPSHTHTLRALDGPPDGRSPAGTVLAVTPQDSAQYSSSAPNASMSAQAILATGNSQPHNNMQPYLAVTYIICLYGIFPSRN